MSPMRPPQVAGIAGGVGTTVIATLLGAADTGRWVPGSHADVLVCRSVAAQLAAVTRAAATITPAPLVVIVADCPDTPPTQVRDRARMLEPDVAAVVWFPWLAPLREAAHPEHTARDAACAQTPPKWARTARLRRDSMIAALTDLLANSGDVVDEPAPPVHDNPPPPTPDRADISPPPPPENGPAVPAVSVMRPRPPAPPPPPAPPGDSWPGVRPDAPQPRQRPAAEPRPRDVRPGDADGLRRTS